MEPMSAQHLYLFECSSSPWQGETIDLKIALIDATKDWVDHTEGNSPCPITFDSADIDETIILAAQQTEADEALEAFKNAIGIVGPHCLVYNEHYEEAITISKKIKEIVLAENPQMAAHWAFDNMDEEQYM
ncbi:hypothetical protein H0H92_000983 [Tricholoma furcatifolium]|nr:hypothetical protein H0H92_000983 [Tricholoma furcatifolium]